MLGDFAPALFTAGLILCAYTLGKVFRPLEKPLRAVAGGFCMLVAIRYVWWRWTQSVPADQSWPQEIWAYLFLLFETATVCSSVLTKMFMARTIDRRPQADALSSVYDPTVPVDIFIPTYNEDARILRRTLAGALNVRHGNKRIWLCDDKARPEIGALAREFGVEYLTRPDNSHAKAGNLNHAYRVANATDRPPEFAIVLDADFIAMPAFLERTLPLFRDPKVGCVQTPQHFFNEDPVQQNLMCGAVWPDEQRFFFNFLLPCKDAWGAAFCCGTGVVFRMAALNANGGMATETVTEDMLTSFQIEEYGYRTIMLNEPLSFGLAPENLAEYVAQRCRWCLGAVQQIRTRWNPFGTAKMSLINRLSILDVEMYWLCTYPFRLLMIAAPIVYWWTGTAVINASLLQLIIWLAPALLAEITFMSSYAEGRVLPIMNDVNHLAVAWPITLSVLTGLLRPKGRAFRVTMKGADPERTGLLVHWKIITPFLVMIVATLIGILINSGPFSAAAARPGYSANVFWSVINMVILLLSTTIAVELPQRRYNLRFDRDDQPVDVRIDGVWTRGILHDISLDGLRVTVPEFSKERLEGAVIEMPEMALGGEPGRLLHGRIGWVRRAGSIARFSPMAAPDYARLVSLLYLPNTIGHIDDVRPTKVVAALFRRVFLAKT